MEKEVIFANKINFSFSDQKKEKTTGLKIKQINSLRYIGGMEGEKGLVQLILNLKEKSRELTFFVKAYDQRFINILKDIVVAYDFLRKKNFKVPNTTRYFSYKDRYYLLMSDITEGGKYRIWSYNDQSTFYEKLQLIEMNLDSQKIIDILKLVEQVSIQANITGINLYFHNYCIRQNKKTLEFEIFLLDIFPGLLEDYGEFDPSISSSNKKEVIKFSDKLRLALK